MKKKIYFIPLFFQLNSSLCKGGMTARAQKGRDQTHIDEAGLTIFCPVATALSTVTEV